MNDQFYHSVYFWMRAEGTSDDAARQTADGCRSHLSGIPGILQMAVGVPAGTPGDIVDNTYGVALLMAFENKAARDAYEDHPDHQRFIADFRHLWSRIQVYDAVPA